MKAPQRLIVGTAAGAFGVRGDLKVRIETDFPDRFGTLRRVFIAGTEYVVERARLHKGQALLKIAGIDTAEAAKALEGLDVEIAFADAVPLPEGKHYIFEIEGLRVETTDGEDLGVIVEVLRTGANDVYIVRSDKGTEVLLPAIAQVVKKIDVAAGLMEVELMEGLR